MAGFIPAIVRTGDVLLLSVVPAKAGTHNHRTLL